MSATRRGGIPGPESRTGLVRPAMTEAEFERRMAVAEAGSSSRPAGPAPSDPGDEDRRRPDADVEPEPDPEPAPRSGGSSSSGGSGRSKGRGRGAAKIRRVQRMFAIEEELDKKLWLYAIHVGKDRSEVVNDLLRPLVGSMVLYDSRDRRSSRQGEGDSEN
ncbi:hypothetical protein [Tautonia plasticadhaerens]|uniref:Uncharacterized protein n=1 Tax=Tautonia plasticadhaerens TaxID=2527974 RepID=A0A518HFH6_9BACT|nr:hypothetical protein [Tautonia plasticadhaerens]QDV39599.1 hypothetical protein ElP_75700 [Tautonia plasticadhaerens]